MSKALFLALIVTLFTLACASPPATSTPVPTPTPALSPSPPSASPTPAFSPTPVVPPPELAFPSLAKVAEKALPAVVSIITETPTLNFFLQPVPEEGAGSGIILDPRGYILTNNHVVAGAVNIQVTLPDGRSFPAEVVGTDALADLAVIKINGENLPTARLGDVDKLKVGDWVVAIGNALGLEGGPTVTAGIVSALHRNIDVPSPQGYTVTLLDVIQTDAPINPGNSGGPLVNLEGEVVGINTAIDTSYAGIGFAISINYARPIIEDLLTQGGVVRPRLGFTGNTVTPAVARLYGLSVDKGVIIVTLSQGGPLQRVGVRRGDVIIKIGGVETPSMPRLQYVLWQHKVGEKVEVTLIRDSQELTVTPTLEERR